MRYHSLKTKSFSSMYSHIIIDIHKKILYLSLSHNFGRCNMAFSHFPEKWHNWQLFAPITDCLMAACPVFSLC